MSPVNCDLSIVNCLSFNSQTCPANCTRKNACIISAIELGQGGVGGGSSLLTFDTIAVVVVVCYCCCCR